MNRYYIIHVMCCQVFLSCFLKLFCNDNLGSRAHARDGARPWMGSLKGLDTQKGREDQSGLTGLHSFAGSVMFGIPNSYP